MINNDVSKASEIFSKCFISEIGEYTIRELIQKQKNDSIKWLVNQDQSYKIADVIFDQINNPHQIDDFLSSIPPLEASCLVKQHFGKKEIIKTTPVLMKHGLNISDIEDYVRKNIYELEKPNEENLIDLKFLLELGVNPNTGCLLSKICHELSRFSKYEIEGNIQIVATAKAMIQLLLEKGADPNLHFKDFFDSNCFPLFSIMKCGPQAFEIAELLLKYHADVNLKTTYYGKNYSIFEYYLLFSTCVKTISLMHESGGKTTSNLLNMVFESVVDGQNLNKNIALVDKLRLIKAYGGKITPKTATSAFNLAIKKGDRELAHFLRENGADASQFEEFVHNVMSR